MSEGEHFRLYRQAAQKGDGHAKRDILQAFSKSKQDLIKRFERFELSHRKLNKALDDLMPFEGLWADIEVGNLGRLCNLLMPEVCHTSREDLDILTIIQELTTHLAMMKKDVWGPLIGDRPGELHKIDVRNLQGLYPSFSTEDRRLVKTKIRNGELFPLIKDKSRRRKLRDRLFSLPRMISSMYTMIQNTKFLEIGGRLLKSLLPTRCTSTLSNHFMKLHNHQATNIIQKCEFIVEEITLESRIAASAKHSQWVAYRMLWLLVLRHFPYISNKKPLMDSTRGEAWESRFEPQWLVDLCDLARLNGYDRIQRPYQNHHEATRRLIKDCIQRNNPDKYYYQLEKQDVKINWIKGCIHDIKKKPQDRLMPEVTSDGAPMTKRLLGKCGIPRASDYNANRMHLFFDKIYTEYDVTPRRSLTPFAYFREFFLSFFGTWDSRKGCCAQQEAVGLRVVSQNTNDQAALTMRTLANKKIPERKMSARRIPIHVGDLSAATTPLFFEASMNSLGETASNSPMPSSAFEDSAGPNTGDNLSISPSQDLFTKDQGIEGSMSIEETSELLFSERRGQHQSMFNILTPDGPRFRYKQLKRKRDSIAKDLKFDNYLVPEKQNKRLKLAGRPGVIEGALRDELDAAIEAPRDKIEELKIMLA